MENTYFFFRDGKYIFEILKYHIFTFTLASSATVSRCNFTKRDVTLFLFFEVWVMTPKYRLDELGFILLVMFLGDWEGAKPNFMRVKICSCNSRQPAMYDSFGMGLGSMYAESLGVRTCFRIVIHCGETIGQQFPHLIECYSLSSMHIGTRHWHVTL